MKGGTCVLLVGTGISAATVENSEAFFKKLGIDLPYDPAVSPPKRVDT